jgi:hypothetical protein
MLGLKDGRRVDRHVIGSGQHVAQPLGRCAIGLVVGPPRGFTAPASPRRPRQAAPRPRPWCKSPPCRLLYTHAPQRGCEAAHRCTRTLRTLPSSGIANASGLRRAMAVVRLQSAAVFSVSQATVPPLGKIPESLGTECGLTYRSRSYNAYKLEGEMLAKQPVLVQQ